MVVQKLTSSAAKKEVYKCVSVCIDLFIVLEVSNGLVHIEMQRRKNYRVFFRQKPVKRHCWRCQFRTVNFFFHYFFLSTIYNVCVFFALLWLLQTTTAECKAINHRRVFFPLEITTKTSIYDTDTIPFM